MNRHCSLRSLSSFWSSYQINLPVWFAATVVSFLLCAVPLIACWQTGSGPLKINNDCVRARFTYAGKPIPAAFVTLLDRKRGAISTKKVDASGWVFFPHVVPGEYKLVMEGPSHETLEISLSPAVSIKTTAAVNFFADYCMEKSILPDQF